MDPNIAHTDATALPPPIVIDCQAAELDELLGKEWLITNRIGAYASGTVVACNTRRYHGLLAAATSPPVGRVMALANVMERLTFGGRSYELGMNEFADTFSPYGLTHLASFANGVIPSFNYRCGQGTLTKELLLAESANALAIRYTYNGPAAMLHLRPLVALRDFHHTRSAARRNRMTFHNAAGSIVVHDRASVECDLHLASLEATFLPDGQWWYGFRYRADADRGYDDTEDLYTPGEFLWQLEDGDMCQFVAGLNEPGLIFFDSVLARRHERQVRLAESVGADADLSTRRLAVATDAFVVQREYAGRPPMTTILAGYHWFADWGRDAFIALPGLLLETGRFDQARQVFQTFCDWVADGLIPNRFDDRTAAAHYNSIDAPLWMCLAAERYVTATGDEATFTDLLLPVMHNILTAMHDGTRFDIRADSDCLLTGGDENTQLTWMDAKSGNIPVTPRHGKAVEINALWYCAHCVMADRCQRAGDERAELYVHRASLIAPAFVRTFWNNDRQCLFDCVNAGGTCTSIRPNQIFAVSLPYSPLSQPQQAAVVQTVRQHLLTPLGLRTLSPEDPAYRGRYEGNIASRDEAYHQGTVWPWLMGPFVEAYLKVNQYRHDACLQTRKWLGDFDAHLLEAGLGYISEVLDGDTPQRPGGCIAQAWSVAEILRAKRLAQSCG